MKNFLVTSFSIMALVCSVTVAHPQVLKGSDNPNENKAKPAQQRGQKSTDKGTKQGVGEATKTDQKADTDKGTKQGIGLGPKTDKNATTGQGTKEGVPGVSKTDSTSSDKGTKQGFGSPIYKNDKDAASHKGSAQTSGNPTQKTKGTQQKPAPAGAEQTAPK